jgi:hypothetical protein
MLWIRIRIDLGWLDLILLNGNADLDPDLGGQKDLIEGRNVLLQSADVLL